jgi:hypothetical protein
LFHAIEYEFKNNYHLLYVIKCKEK